MLLPCFRCSSYAPVRVRQDPATFTVLLAVRNVIAESLRVWWAPGSPSHALRLLVTCVSRGGGSCDLDWGVVLHCPADGAPTLDPREAARALLEDEAVEPIDLGSPPVSPLDEQPTTMDNDLLGKPDVICCDVTKSNVTFTFCKPAVMGEDAEKGVWWDAIAVGRTLGPGLEVGFCSCCFLYLFE